VLENLGNLERKLGNNDVARAAYQDALTLYKQVGDKLGQAGVLVLRSTKTFT
jgi:hypothetical protein